MLNVQEAMSIVYSLAEQNALSKWEVRDEPDLYDEFNRQHDSLEIVDAFMDNGCEFDSEVCSEYDCGQALAIVHELASDNIIDEDMAYQDETLTRQREIQLEACAVVEDHIVNHYGEE